MATKELSGPALVHLIQELGWSRLRALHDFLGETRDFADSLLARGFVVPLHDKEVPERLQGRLVNWRRMADKWHYTGPVAWRVKAGFTLKQHAPQTGPCRDKFQYLQDWSFVDEPTPEAICFWIPRLVPQSTNKFVDEQDNLLTFLREQYNLPDYHLAGFGKGSLLAALILAEFWRSGDRVPLKGLWTRTDTLHADHGRLGLGNFGEGGLTCDWGWDDHYSYRLGCFALGVEELEQ